MGLIQHHDAVTGTERYIAAQDYIAQIEESKKEVRNTLLELLKLDKEVDRNEICIDSASDSNCKVGKLIEPPQSGVLYYIIVNPGFEGVYPHRFYIKKDIDFVLKNNDGSEVVYDKICYEDLKYCDVVIMIDFKMNMLFYKISIGMSESKYSYFNRFR